MNSILNLNVKFEIINCSECQKKYASTLPMTIRYL